MSTLELLPARIAEKSISQQEIVLPMTEALEAIDLLEPNRQAGLRKREIDELLRRSRVCKRRTGISK